jgi:hypothetical protein
MLPEDVDQLNLDDARTTFVMQPRPRVAAHLPCCWARSRYGTAISTSTRMSMRSEQRSGDAAAVVLHLRQRAGARTLRIAHEPVARAMGLQLRGDG